MTDATATPSASFGTMPPRTRRSDLLEKLYDGTAKQADIDA